jgi:hypothetical protein
MASFFASCVFAFQFCCHLLTGGKPYSCMAVRYDEGGMPLFCDINGADWSDSSDDDREFYSFEAARRWASCLSCQPNKVGLVCKFDAKRYDDGELVTEFAAVLACSPLGTVVDWVYTDETPFVVRQIA